MTVYLNVKYPQGRETVDQFTQGEDAPADRRGFRAYVRDMLREYHLCGIQAYRSSRPCAGWNTES